MNGRREMEEPLRKALKVIENLFKGWVWIDNILFLLMVFFLLGYALYLGWTHPHQH